MTNEETFITEYTEKRNSWILTNDSVLEIYKKKISLLFFYWIHTERKGHRTNSQDNNEETLFHPKILDQRKVKKKQNLRVNKVILQGSTLKEK